MSLLHSICYATLTLGIALWVLLLDKQSAFDSVLKEHILAEAYTAAGYHADQSLFYMDNRLPGALFSSSPPPSWAQYMTREEWSRVDLTLVTSSS